MQSSIIWTVIGSYIGLAPNRREVIFVIMIPSFIDAYERILA